ncbi:DUF433 domain-containing protein [Trichocoleus sp. FACHB-90]|uniref:DUF433 domain-containing protein n=1 Tax=Cyanophyceae TaxID=3028117 RepID=UPI001689E3F7|nr:MULTISPECIES: DUF433 domain-containing protein [unclassified Trichocoleus]MBD1926998.1 DUF433 domain-containing protein [Trichocoleus sp. FACHB-90]MBD1930905.1 DUF433 domain-containing protein [Trichocoleus sp. FACHB-69]
MTVKELEAQLEALTPTEKAEAIQILTKTLSNGSLGITKTPGVMGGDACISKTRLPVWLFVSLRRQGASDAQLLKFYPHISAADLVNVWAYADAHPEEIETALREQDEAMQEEA